MAENKENSLVLNASERQFVQDIRIIISSGRSKAYESVNAVMIQTYWHIGKRIVEQEQNGVDRAEYGAHLLEVLSSELKSEFGNGFGERTLRHFRQFYLTFPDIEIWTTRVPNLTWSHFRTLLRVSDETARNWYLSEAASEQWSVRTLDRNVSSQYYHRMLQSQNGDSVRKEMESLTSQSKPDKLEFIKNPVVAEFLGLGGNADFRESELEQAIITHLQKFLLELGKGYAFVARQKHIATDAGDFYIDLVFYNFLMKCFVLIDLKTSQISHQDVGQMDMYRRMYDDLVKGPDDNPTIGIILCSETSNDIARYSILNDNGQLYAAKYLTYLPSEDELRREIEQQKEFFRLQNE